MFGFMHMSCVVHGLRGVWCFVSRAGGNSIAGTVMAVPVFEGEKMASLGF